MDKLKIPLNEMSLGEIKELKKLLKDEIEKREEIDYNFCGYCGQQINSENGHWARDCPSKDLICIFCGEKHTGAYNWVKSCPLYKYT